MIISTETNLTDIVYLKTDSDRNTRLVTGIWVMGIPGHLTVKYELTCGDRSSWHFDYEFTKDKNEIIFNL